MTSHPRAFSLAFLPLDERPVNVGLPAGIAAIAGATLVLPPDDLLPQLRQPGDADALGRWLESTAPTADAVITSLDMLCYGGLIAARTTADTTLGALTRLDVLRRLHAAHPSLLLCAVSLVMRASNSYNPQEEPDYWAQHGMELHKLGALHHRDLLETLDAGTFDGNADELSILRTALPADIVADFERRRLRNHHVNLEAIALASEGVIDPLLITADDTAEHSAGSAEQVWLKQWTNVLPISGEVLMYPGADEVAAVLVARQLGARFGVAPRFTVECADPPGMERIAKYENSPMREAVARQIHASGSTIVDDATAMALVVHAPDPKRRDHCGMVVQKSGTGHDGTESIFDAADATEATKSADLIAQLLAAGRDVALADLRYSNGADPLLIEELHRRGILLDLVAYGGWNTAGNALGSVVAAAAAIQIGRAADTLDPTAARRVLLHRLIEDFAYMTDARRPLNAGVYTFPDRAEETAAEQAIGTDLDASLKRLTGRSDLGITDVRFPWRRSFEVDFTIAGDLS